MTDDVIKLIAALRAAIEAHPGIKRAAIQRDFLPDTPEYVDLVTTTDEDVRRLAAGFGITPRAIRQRDRLAWWLDASGTVDGVYVSIAGPHHEGEPPSGDTRPTP